MMEMLYVAENLSGGMVFGNYVHNKTGNVYMVIGASTNETNNNDGQIMIHYCRHGRSFVREISEFKEKFTLLKEDR